MRRWLLSILTLGTSLAHADLQPLERLPLSVKPVGYVRGAFFQTDASETDALVGARNGFRLLNARLGVLIEATQALQVEISAEGAALRVQPGDPLEGERTVALRDAYVAWRPQVWTHFYVGQFKAPYNAETLMSDADLPFVTRSILTDGIAPPDAFTRPGLTLDRHVGAQLRSGLLSMGNFEFTYAFALVNGNGQNSPYNDNNGLMPVGRLTFGLKNLITLGLNGYWNTLEQGIRPNRLRLQQTSAGADLLVHLGEVHVMGLILWRESTTLDTQLPKEEALGAMAQVQWLNKASGMELAVRGTAFEPSSVDPQDQLLELSAMVGYRFGDWPARLALQYTARYEQPEAAIDNNSVDAMVQVNF